MEIKTLNPREADVRAIIQDIDTLMNSLYPAESNQLLSVAELESDHVHFIGGMLNDQIACCGAIVHKNNDGVYGELKRIYVLPEFRGKGLSRKIMTALLDHAASLGLSMIRLETGTRQPEAIGLYEALGFTRRGPYGDYPDDPFSVFMELDTRR